MRGGTAKLLTLFRPATGEVRAEPVDRTPHVVFQEWRRRERAVIGAAGPPAPVVPGPGHRGEDWPVTPPPPGWAEGLPPLRVRLIGDHRAGHGDWELEQDRLHQGILPLSTPVAGSWRNLAEAIQRIRVRRALAGQQPQNAAEVKAWLAAAVRGWNADPTPFEGGGKRAARRQRARQRRHTLGGAAGYTRRPIRRCRCRRSTTAFASHHDK